MNPQDRHSDKLRQHAKVHGGSLAVLIVVTFFTALYMKGLNSGIPLYYDSLGYSATVGGTFVAAFTLACTVMRVLGGPITDNFSHYKVLLICLMALFIGVAIPLFSNVFAVVMAARIVQGAGFALATNVMTVAVMGTASKAHLGSRLGVKSAGTSLGTMLGALVSTLLLDSGGYMWFYGFYAALMLVALAAVVAQHIYAKKLTVASATDSDNRLSIDNSKYGAASVDEIAAAKAKIHSGVRELLASYLSLDTLPYMIISFVQRIPKGFCVAFILIFAKSAGIEYGATFFVVAGAVTLVCGLVGGRLYDSNRVGMLLPLMCMQVIGFAALVVAPGIASLLFAAVCYGISMGMTSPFLKALTAKATPKDRWGIENGQLNFYGDIGKALGAYVGGLAIDATAKSAIPEIALAISIICAAITAAAVLTLRLRQRQY